MEFWRQNEETGTTELVFRVGCDSPSTIDMRQRQDLLSGAGGFGWPVPQTGVTLFQIYYLAGFMNYVYNVHIYINMYIYMICMYIICTMCIHIYIYVYINVCIYLLNAACLST